MHPLIKNFEARKAHGFIAPGSMWWSYYFGLFGLAGVAERITASPSKARLKLLRTYFTSNIMGMPELYDNEDATIDAFSQVIADYMHDAGERNCDVVGIWMKALDLYLTEKADDEYHRSFQLRIVMAFEEKRRKGEF